MILVSSLRGHYRPNLEAVLGLVIIMNFLQPVKLSFSEVQRVFRMLPTRIIQREPFLAMQRVPVSSVRLIEQRRQFLTPATFEHEPEMIHRRRLRLQAVRGVHRSLTQRETEAPPEHF